MRPLPPPARPRLAAPGAGLTAAPAFAGAVLCGGESRRMGVDKATLAVDGTAMAVHVAGALHRAGARTVFAVGGDAAALEGLGLRVVPDDQPGEGPFPATLTALRHAGEPLVAVLSCDLTAPDAGTIAALVGALGATEPGVLGAVPVVAGHHQWTHAVWRAAALPALEQAQAAGHRSLRRAAGSLALVEMHHLDPRHLADADAPADLAAASPEPAGTEVASRRWTSRRST